jgi:hypothetical protein
MKRKRTDLTWWEEPFKKWMQSNGGFVHSNIELLEDRELFCEKKVDPDTIILSTDPDGVVTTTSTIFFLPNMQFESIKLLDIVLVELIPFIFTVDVVVVLHIELTHDLQVFQLLCRDKLHQVGFSFEQVLHLDR